MTVSSCSTVLGPSSDSAVSIHEHSQEADDGSNDQWLHYKITSPINRMSEAGVFAAQRCKSL